MADDENIETTPVNLEPSAGNAPELDPAEVVAAAADAAGNDPVDAAVAALDALQGIQVTVGGGPGAELPPVKFPRTSVERRVLGHVTDEVDLTALGPRNTLAALTYALVRDRNTTHPAGENAKLDTDGATTAQSAQLVLEHLQRLEDEGLVEEDAGHYTVTDAGWTELRS